MNASVGFHSGHMVRIQDVCVYHGILTLVHGTQHAGGKPVNGIGLLDKRDKGGDPALVIG